MVNTWTESFITEQDWGRVKAKGSLGPCVLVEGGERYGEAAEPFVLKSLVDSATALLFVLQEVGLNLVGFCFVKAVLQC